VTSDPTVGIGTPCDALIVAETLLQIAAVAVEHAHPVCDRGGWESQAAGVLAAVLYAASPRGNGAGMAWVVAAVANTGVDDGANPGWLRAASLCRAKPALAHALLRVWGMGARQRDSMVITMREALVDWS
jgi:type IV secretion system protein VirD4